MTITTLFAIFSPIYPDDFIAYLVYAFIVAMVVLAVDARAIILSPVLTECPGILGLEEGGVGPEVVRHE